VTSSDTEDFLDVILQRINLKQNGSQWQRNFIINQHQSSRSQDVFKLMTQVYLKNQQSGKPVSEWESM
jgi:hypothetical protein